jgi:hypothetical protein
VAATSGPPALGDGPLDVPGDKLYNLFHYDYMNENQGTWPIYRGPMEYDMTIPQNVQAVEEINKQPEYKP